MSFCENSDLLSQWRGYASNTAGYSIGFQSNRLQKISNFHGGRLGQCIYDEAKQTEIINQLIDVLLLNVTQESSSLDKACENFQNTFLKYAAFFKDSSFSEEQEWRLVTKVVSYGEPEFSFRPGKSMLIPYLKLALGKSVQDHWEKDISLVTVGPCPHPEASQMAVSGLLIRHHIIRADLAADISPQHARVVTSKVPFRNW